MDAVQSICDLEFKNIYTRCMLFNCVWLSLLIMVLGLLICRISMSLKNKKQQSIVIARLLMLRMHLQSSHGLEKHKRRWKTYRKKGNQCQRTLTRYYFSNFTFFTLFWLVKIHCICITLSDRIPHAEIGCPL